MKTKMNTNNETNLLNSTIKFSYDYVFSTDKMQFHCDSFKIIEGSFVCANCNKILSDHAIDHEDRNLIKYGSEFFCSGDCILEYAGYKEKYDKKELLERIFDKLFENEGDQYPEFPLDDANENSYIDCDKDFIYIEIGSKAYKLSIEEIKPLNDSTYNNDTE